MKKDHLYIDIITTNKCTITNSRTMLNFPIIIYGNSATANINTGPNITITDIGEMWELSTFPNIRVFNFYKVTYMNLIT